MNYRITGIGAENIELDYRENELIGAARLAHKMSDNGVRQVHIFGPDGDEITLEQAYRDAELRD